MPMVLQREPRKMHPEEHLEIPFEVWEKIECVTEDSRLIAEHEVCGLKYVSIAHSKYFIPERIMDIVLSFIGLALSSIPMLLVFLIMYIDDPDPVIFTQYRVGVGDRRFKLYKLRTGLT